MPDDAVSFVVVGGPGLDLDVRASLLQDAACTGSSSLSHHLARPATVVATRARPGAPEWELLAALNRCAPSPVWITGATSDVRSIGQVGNPGCSILVGVPGLCCGLQKGYPCSRCLVGRAGGGLAPNSLPSGVRIVGPDPHTNREAQRPPRDPGVGAGRIGRALELGSDPRGSTAGWFGSVHGLPRERAGPVRVGYLAHSPC